MKVYMNNIQISRTHLMIQRHFTHDSHHNIFQYLIKNIELYIHGIPPFHHLTPFIYDESASPVVKCVLRQ